MLRLAFMALAMLAAISGTVLYMMNDNLAWMPQGVATIGGTACFMLSGMFWMLFGMSYRIQKQQHRRDKDIE